MNSRHAAALVLLGWHLIVPPSLTWKSKQTQLANVAADRWEIIETHDNEKRCLARLDRLEVKALRDWQRKPLTFKLMQAVNRQLAAECVDDSDPRINPIAPGGDFARGVISKEKVE